MANCALRTSPKFTTRVKYQFHQGVDKIRNLEIAITLRLTFILFLVDLYFLSNVIILGLIFLFFKKQRGPKKCIHTLTGDI